MDPMAAEGLTDAETVPSLVQGGCGALEEVGFYNIERDIKLENLEEIDEETWVQYYSVPDRRYIYTAVKATLSQAANDAYENEKKNGILLLHRLWKLHGAPNLANTISAPTELLNIETTMHQDPAPNLQVAGAYFDRVFPRHTGQHEDRLAHADDLASCRFGNAVAAEVQKTLTKNATALATNEGLPQLKRPHRATTVGKSRSNIPPTAPTHALEEDADAEAVVQREAADEDTAADTPSMDRSTSRTLNASNVGSLGITPTTRGQRRDVSLSRLELYDNRGNTYPIKIVDNFFCVEVAPPLDFDMTIDTTFHQSPGIRYPCARGTTSLHRDSLISTKRKSRLALRPEQNSANIRHRRHRHQETHAPLSRR
ncbi:hypothetical protein RI054_16g76680 [Pseudoscourfieldia marina]